MKATVFALTVTAVLSSLSIYGCSSTSTPEESAQIYQKYLCEGKAAKALEMFEPQLTELLGKQLTLEMLQNEGKVCQSKGGMKSFTILKKENISESRVLYTVAISYNNGITEKPTIAMRPINGGWYVSAH